MRSDDDVERFCDAFAAALLLPVAAVRQCRHRPRNLVTVRHLAGRTRTSLAATTVRLNELAGWSSALLHWRREEHAWTYRWGAALPADLGRLRSGPRTSAALDHLRSAGPRDQPARVPMLLGRNEIDLDGEFSCRGRSAIGLVHLATEPPKALN